MFSAMMHAQNKWTGDALREAPVQPTVVQPVPYSTFMGVQNLTDNTRVIHFRQDLNVTAPSDINPTGYMWSVVDGDDFRTLGVFSGETTNSAVFATSFQYLRELPKDCIVQCNVSTVDKVYKIPHVIRWRSQQDPPVIATITNSANTHAINATNIVFTQQPTIQIVGSTIATWSWSLHLPLTLQMQPRLLQHLLQLFQQMNCRHIMQLRATFHTLIQLDTIGQIKSFQSFMCINGKNVSHS